MTKTFTHDDLIRYIYRETSDEEDKELEHTLLCDPRLSEALKELKSLFNNLDGILEEPSERLINNILNYSKAVSCHSVN